VRSAKPISRHQGRNKVFEELQCKKPYLSLIATLVEGEKHGSAHTFNLIDLIDRKVYGYKNKVNKVFEIVAMLGATEVAL
jgi:hypothetical protein